MSGRRVESLDLVGVAEVAAMLGVGKSALWDRRFHWRFPKPVAELRCGPIWLRAQIERYLAG
jgi:predicted DNA-binding transcriptional regulator AlpA